MRKLILFLFLVTCCMTQYSFAGCGAGGCGVPASFDSSDISVNSDVSYDSGVADQANCQPQPTDAYPTVCYKPYVYYVPKYTCTRECENISVPCKKRCCRMVPQYYEQTYCKYVPQYETKQCCRMVPQYYYEDDCKTCKRWYTQRHCTYEPRYFYKKECIPGCGVSAPVAPAASACCPAQY